MSAKRIQIKLSSDPLDLQNSTIYLVREACRQMVARRKVSCLVNIEMPNGHTLSLQLKVIGSPEKIG